jgi:Terminase large subunit, T4likevirus-type, N-terminal
MRSQSSVPTLQEWKLAGAAPRYATPATPGRPHDGARAEALARALGRPLMPWQSYVAAVATERMPDNSYAYPVVVVSVPRQSGKTLLLTVLLLLRCIREDHHQAFYTAQTGKDARARWADMVKLITGSPLRSLVRVRRSQGSERLELPNGSVFQVFAPTPDSLHGYTPPTVALDEAFAHDERHGDELEGAIEPAQQTLPHRQLWIVSTRGDVDSVFLDRWLEKGAAGTPGVALFDWGAADHHDPRDPADVLAFHPAVGLPHGLGNGTNVETIVSSKLSEPAYERAYANRPTQGGELKRIGAQEWSDLGGELEPPGDTPMALTYDVAHDRTAATISASWRDSSGHLCHKLVRWDLGVAWCAPAVVEMARRWANVKTVAADDTGPAREVTAQLKRIRLPRGMEPRILTTRELTVSWGELLELVKVHGFTHCGNGHLSDAAAAVVPRPLLDSEAPSRRFSPGDISPLMACMVGLYAVQNRPVISDRPLIHFA